jgi:hypothetical protein
MTLLRVKVLDYLPTYLAHAPWDATLTPVAQTLELAKMRHYRVVSLDAGAPAADLPAEDHANSRLRFLCASCIWTDRGATASGARHPPSHLW